MRDRIKIFGCVHTVNPKPFLSGLLETGVVAFGFGSEGVDFFERDTIAVNRKSVTVVNGNIFCATLVFLPVVHKKDKNEKEIDKIACSEFWKGKDSYKKLQDSFHQYMNENEFLLERGKETQREHLTVEELKTVSSYEKIKAEIEKTPIKETESDQLDLVLAENKKLVKHCNRLREYCIRSANTFEKCNQYQEEIEHLKQENSSLKVKIKKLEQHIKDIYHMLENVFKISKTKLFQLLERLR